MASRTVAKTPENHVIDPGVLREAIQTVAERVADNIRQAPDTRVRLPRSNWTVGEAAAHLAITQGQFTERLEGTTSPFGDSRIEAIAAVNAQSLAAFRERDRARLAELIVTRTQAFLAASSRYPQHHTTRLGFGALDLPTYTGYMLSHLLMHGCPIARALHRPLPVEPTHMELLLPLFKAWVEGRSHEGATPPRNACIEVRVRRGRRFAIQFENGQITVEDAPTKRVDCYLSADPVAFLLVAAGIVGQWGPIARGKLVAWGPKPWLALRLKSYLPNP